MNSQTTIISIGTLPQGRLIESGSWYCLDSVQWRALAGNEKKVISPFAPLFLGCWTENNSAKGQILDKSFSYHLNDFFPFISIPVSISFSFVF